jgi:hypothetical protein
MKHIHVIVQEMKHQLFNGVGKWNQPNKLKGFAFLFSGMILFIATGLIIFKRRFEIELQNTQ